MKYNLKMKTNAKKNVRIFIKIALILLVTYNEKKKSVYYAQIRRGKLKYRSIKILYTEVR